MHGSAGSCAFPACFINSLPRLWFFVGGTWGCASFLGCPCACLVLAVCWLCCCCSRCLSCGWVYLPEGNSPWHWAIYSHLSLDGLQQSTQYRPAHMHDCLVLRAAPCSQASMFTLHALLHMQASHLAQRRQSPMQPNFTQHPWGPCMLCLDRLLKHH